MSGGQFTGLPFVLPEHLAQRAIYRYLQWNERRNQGKPQMSPEIDGQLDWWRKEMSADGGYVVGYDEELLPDPEGTPEEQWTSVRGEGFFFVSPRHPEDPTGTEAKPLFVTLRDSKGRFRTREELRRRPPEDVEAKRHINLRGM